MNKQQILNHFGIQATNSGTWIDSKTLVGTGTITSVSPIDGEVLASVDITTEQNFKEIITKAKAAQKLWQAKPAPLRGDIVRQFGDVLRENKDPLGALVSIEMGKSLQEGLGEVQEMIDICEFAVGLSRQLYGLTMHSERPNHRMYEQWHPLGIVGIISAFNFPVAVWSWNTALAWICGNVTIWKPSEKTPLTAIACQVLWNKVAEANNLPEGISSIVNGRVEVGEMLTKTKDVALVSATGSTRMGREVAKNVSDRFGKSLLELGGNNALIVTENADLNIAIPAIVFGAVGTCGQRCTSTRRLLLHKSISKKVIDTLVKAYSQLRIGDPLDQNNLVGPLIDAQSVEQYNACIKEALNQGAELLTDHGPLTVKGFEGGSYVKPCALKIDSSAPITKTETFAPVLYVMEYDTLEEALAIQNDVPQGLSSAIFTESMKEAEYFLSCAGSDCGIANVNIGTSGAEIGGAFGGEKETGGGRESGSDAWKSYMRRQTNTINYSDQLPLAQGIKFEL
jgi:aldehyde dehydrogenase (NAD+)